MEKPVGCLLARQPTQPFRQRRRRHATAWSKVSVRLAAPDMPFHPMYGANMKRLLSMVIAASLLAGGGLALASPPGGYGYDHDKQDKHDKYDKHDKHGDDGDYGHHDNGKHKGWYKKGDHLPDHYYGHDYEVDDYER